MFTSGGNRKMENADNPTAGYDNDHDASSQQPYRQPMAGLNATASFQVVDANGHNRENSLMWPLLKIP